jgi:hypothetical protein
VGKLCGKIGGEMSLDFYMQRYMNLDEISYGDLISMLSFEISEKEAKKIIYNAVNSGFLTYSRHYTPNEHYYRGSNLRPTIMCYFFKVINVIEWAQKERSVNPDFSLVFSKEFMEHHRNRIRVFCETAEKISDYPDKASFFRSLAIEIKNDVAGKIDLTLPLIIEAMVIFLGLRVSKNATVYNHNGKEKSGCSYDSIRKHIEDLFPCGIHGNLTKDGKSDRKDKQSFLKKVLSAEKYDKFPENFKKLK